MAAGSGPTPLDPSEDARLLDRCLAGDSKAWEALVRRHERLVYAVGRSYRLSDEDLGDVFQEVFVALVRGLPRICEPRALVRWLSSTTQRIARTTALRRRREAALGVGLDTGLGATLPSREPAVGAELERLEEQAMLRLAMESLSPRCRDLLAALYFEDPAPAYSALSRRLGLPVGSIGPTRGRCFERLKAAYERLESPGAGISARDASTFHIGSKGPDRTRFGSPAGGPGATAAPMEEHP